MPGINIHYSTGRVTEGSRRRFQRAAELSCFESRLQVVDIYAGPTTYCSFTDFEHYPHTQYETDDYLILVEGSIYNLRDELLKPLLLELAPGVLSGSPDYRQRLREALSRFSGEFVLLFIEKKSGALAVVSDILGQLPLFHTSTAEGIFISRDLKFVLAASGRKDFDRQALAQHLHIGIIIGEKTLFRDVSMVPQAAVVRCVPGARNITPEIVHRWDFSTMEEPHLDHRELACELKRVYLEALQDRLRALADVEPLLALSGGLDSRAALAGLMSLRGKAEAYTCLNGLRANRIDFVLGRRVAEHLGARWQGHKLDWGQPEALMEIVYNQCGTTSTVMVHGYGYDSLRAEYGNARMLVTGDGGFLVRRPLAPPKPIETPEDFLAMTVNKLIVCDQDRLAGLLRTTPEAVREACLDGISEYEDSRWRERYSYFMFVDRPRRYVMTGQDRSRYHFWVVAPLWDRKFFETVLRTPGYYKSNYELYAELLRELDERTLDVPYANIRARLGSRKAALIGRIKRLASSRPPLFRAAKRLALRGHYRPYRYPDFTNYLLTESRKSDLVREFFDLKSVERNLNDGLPAATYHLLATVLTTMILIEKDFPKPEAELDATGFGASLHAAKTHESTCL